MDKLSFFINLTFYQTMTLKIDFYLATAGDFRACHPLCYQLVNNSYANRNDIQILFNQLEDAQWYDRFFWTHRADDFLPHLIDQNKNRITIEHLNNPNPSTQLNMQVGDSTLLSSIHHLIQIVPNNESDKQQARELYKTFQQLGHTITVHKDA